ncbi:hypothetical protein Lal_00012379 [Lupinus albus]|nr:hypothetical protein Lal_00012379 [Lupinus albus]
MVKERYQHESISDLKLKLISDRVIDERIYNMPTVSEVAAFIVGDVDNPSKRDIILEKQSDKLKRINELHTSYLGYQYPLLFPYGEDGYRHDVCYSSTCSRQYKRNRVTIKYWLCFRLQARRNEVETLLRSRRLFNNFWLIVIYPSPEDIDNIITTEIPNPMEEHEIYELFKSHMVHGPCGNENSKSPCMNNEKCTKYYPKKFQPNTIVDQEGVSSSGKYNA